MKFEIKADLRDVRKKTARLRRRTPIATAQELNTQRRQSRTIQTRNLSKLLGVRPQKRIRRRMLIPRGGAATASNLKATGLSLVEVMPARWFARGRRGPLSLRLTAGAALITRDSAESRPFRAPNKAGRADVFRRAGPARLPIRTAYVDTSVPGYAVRGGMLVQLAREWPARWSRRMQREINRAFR